MLFQVYTENGVKKIKYLTADTGTGAPVGSYLMLEKKSNPQGYLYCDGSTFDSTAYPALYQYLGTNVLPDFREFSPVGAEQNTTNVYDAQTNPNGVIHTHDVYTQGEAKDDQLQEHNHDLKQGNALINKGSITVGRDTSSVVFGDGNVYGYVSISNNSGRKGTVTRSKSRAVFIYIKATSGLTENQQENVLNTINENNSYSTEEHPTGKKWIDGKPIYSKVIEQNFGTGQTVITHNLGISRYIDVRVFVGSVQYVNSYLSSQYNISVYDLNVNTLSVTCNSWVGSGYIILEYTKTTDV